MPPLSPRSAASASPIAWLSFSRFISRARVAASVSSSPGTGASSSSSDWTCRQ